MLHFVQHENSVTDNNESLGIKKKVMNSSSTYLTCAVLNLLRTTLNILITLKLNNVVCILLYNQCYRAIFRKRAQLTKQNVVSSLKTCQVRNPQSQITVDT